ncbi:MAG: SBBP repeat-containing protein [Bryobacteraceae bacterium]
MPRAGLFFAVHGIAAVTLSAQLSSTPETPVRYTFSLAIGAQITAATVDQGGNLYLGGSTNVPLPATSGAFQATFGACPATAGEPPVGHPPCSWAFVGKLSPSGSIIWLTYLADPNGSSIVKKIAVDARGSVYVAGTYGTMDNLPSKFPVTTGGFETSTDSMFGVFIAELNPSGSQLVYATYFNQINSVSAIQPDSEGNLYLGMLPDTPADLPLVDPLSGTTPSGNSGYLAKLNATGSALLFATRLSAPGAQGGVFALTLDGQDNLYAVGGCANLSLVADACFPTTPGVLQGSMNGYTAGFVLKLSPAGTLVFSTLLGFDGSSEIQVDASGEIVLAGDAPLPVGVQPQIPVTPMAFQTTVLKRAPGPSSVTFLAKLNSSGSALLYATYFGGSSDDNMTGLALDSQGNAVFGGLSSSPDLPMTPDAWQPCHPLPDFEYGNGAEADFIAQLSSNGQSLNYSSFVGPGQIFPNGQEGSTLNLIGMDATGDLYLIGTQSEFPIVLRYHMTSQPKGSAACIVNATDGYESAVSPLGFIQIRGNGVDGGRSLSPTLTAAGILPTNYDGLRVFMDDSPVPLLSIGPNQITVVVPSALPTGDSVPIRVIQTDVVTAELESAVQSTAPAIITTDGSGFGTAAAINQDGSVNSESNPAIPGSIVALYLTGLGVVGPPIQEGTIATSLALVQATVQASMYNSNVETLYVGPAPGLLAGVYQMNIIVPITGFDSWVPLGIIVGGQYAQADAGIYVSCPAASQCVSSP